jgi:hypothetical protein
MSRRFGPRTAERAASDAKDGRNCPACRKPFLEGDYTTLIALGPGDDPEARERCKANRPYNAVALEIHYDCADLRNEE